MFLRKFRSCLASVSLGTSLGVLTLSLAPFLVSQKAMAECDKPIDSSFYEFRGGDVIDQSGAVTWQRCLVGKSWDAASSRCIGTVRNMTWDKAIEYVKGLKPSAEGLWRLPTPFELVTLVDYNCPNSDKKTKWFVDPDARVLWSGATYGPIADYAWGLKPVKGELIYEMKSDEFQLLLVRSNR